MLTHLLSQENTVWVLHSDCFVLYQLGDRVKNQHCSFLCVTGTNGRGSWPRALVAPGWGRAWQMAGDDLGLKTGEGTPTALAVNCKCQLMLHQQQLGAICRASLQRQILVVIIHYRLSYSVTCILFINHLKQVGFLQQHCKANSNTPHLEQLFGKWFRDRRRLLPLWCVFTGTPVCASCWCQTQAAHVCRALAAGGPGARFTNGVLQLATCCITVTLKPPGKKKQDVERCRICTPQGFENMDAGKT